jgi:hypothetical protein
MNSALANRLVNIVLIFALIGSTIVMFSRAAVVEGWYGSMEQDQVNRINLSRSEIGVAPLLHIECLNDIAEAWSKHMSDTNNLYHNPNVVTEVQQKCGSWTSLAENVAFGGSSSSIFSGFMSSTGHKANILNTKYTRVGIGAYMRGDGRLWVTQVFGNCTTCNTNWSTNATVAGEPTVPGSPPTKTGDINNDTKIDAIDLSILLSNWNRTGTNTADINKDSIVNAIDLSILLTNWGK